MLGSLIGFVLEHWTWLAGGGGLVGTVAAAFIPGAGPVLAFLRANWKWLVPCIVALGLGIYAGTQRINYLECKSDRATARADAEAEVRRFKDADRALSDKLVADYAGEIAELQGKYEDAQIKLERAGVGACGFGDPGRAFYDGVLELQRGAAGGDPRGAGGAQAPVPAATTAPRRRIP